MIIRRDGPEVLQVPDCNHLPVGRQDGGEVGLRGTRTSPHDAVRDPAMPTKWQDAADAAEFLLNLDAGRQFGLLTGGPGVNVERCADIRAKGKELGSPAPVCPRAPLEALTPAISQPPSTWIDPVDVEHQLRNICWSALAEPDFEIVVDRIVQDILRIFDVQPKYETVAVKEER